MTTYRIWFVYRGQTCRMNIESHSPRSAVREVRLECPGARVNAVRDVSNNVRIPRRQYDTTRRPALAS